MGYFEHPPPAALAPWIQCFRTLPGAPGGRSGRIAPRLEALADALLGQAAGAREAPNEAVLEAVGAPPSVARRVVRFQAALQALHAHPRRTPTRVAPDAGYHDQAHLGREFQALAGEAPGAYRRGRGLAP